MAYQVSVIIGQGANLIGVAGANPNRRYVEIINVGYGPAFIGDRNNTDPNAGGGTRIRPGQQRRFTTQAGLFAVTYPGTNYILEVIEE